MTTKEKKNKINIMTAVQAIHRHVQGTVLEGNTVRITLPFKANDGNPITLYFAYEQEKKSAKHLMYSPLSYLTTLTSNPETIHILCKEYGCFLAPAEEISDHLIVENSDMSLTERTRNLMQAIIAIDGTIRIRKSLNERVVSTSPSKTSVNTAAIRTSTKPNREAKKQPRSKRKHLT
jgi:hypothetical protein